MMIELAWPAKALSPNARSRSHWPKTRALAAAKLEGFAVTKAALHGQPFKHDGSRLAFVITAYPPTKRDRDDDNFTAILKGHRDGIALALGIDDKLFDQRVHFAEPCKPGKVVITIGGVGVSGGGTAYYNEHDPFAAAWLRELIADGLIAPGEVDERSIEDVLPSDLAGFVQCHFFAGIGVWSLALREAGWPDSKPIWTGSCPCQPFSAAGKGGGFDDERHLWPAFHWLIEQCGPELVIGEQVASKDGLAWLDLVSADVEASGYAFGAADTCAAGFGAPHIRQRLYWMADALPAGRTEGRTIAGNGPATWSRIGCGLADTDGRNAGSERQQRSREQRQQPQDGRAGGVGNTADEPCERDAGQFSATETGSDGARFAVDGRLSDRPEYAGSGMGERPGPLNGLWSDADWLCCTDGKWRPVSAGTFPLAPAGTVRNRVGQLRGAGNAINLAQAQGFIEAVIEVRAIADRNPTGGDVKQAPSRSDESGGAVGNRPESPSHQHGVVG